MQTTLGFLTSAGAAPVFQVIRWTPEMAKEAFETLNNHPHQRLFKLEVARKYMRKMLAGEWVPAFPQCVLAFSTDRHILNGQHTLWAIWNSGITIDVCTNWNVSPDVFKLFDDFEKRNLGQILKQESINNRNVRASVTKLIMAIDEEYGSQVMPTVDEVVRCTITNELMNEVITYIVGQTKGPLRRSESVSTYAVYQIALIHGLEVATAFFDRVHNGVNLTANDPRLHLARFMLSRSTATWNDRVAIIIGIIKAFNAWANAMPMSLLSVKAGEKMPKVVELPTKAMLKFAHA
jgi:hypothetical protein